MRAESRACPAMAANDRFFCFLVEVDSAHDTDFFAFSATDAHVVLYQHAASGPFFQRIARAYFHTCRVLATKAHNRDETAGHAAAGAHPDSAFYERMVFSVRNCANTHAGKAAQALVHVN